MDLAGRISAAALELFGRPEVPKPRRGREWTVYAAVVEERPAEGREECLLRAVAAGTGSKCLGASGRSPDGGLVHDSHAEAVARRAFRRYLHAAVADPTRRAEIFEKTVSADKPLLPFRLRKGVRYHMFSTHPPCGDASLPVADDDDGGENGAIPAKKQKMSPEAPDEADHPVLERGLDNPWRTGLIRTKPGRGDPTRSASCSDKLLKWRAVGLQGSLLSHLLAEKIPLSSFTLLSHPDAKTLDALGESVDRALNRRFGLECPRVHLHLGDCGGDFEFSRTSSKEEDGGRTANVLQPSHCSAAVVVMSSGKIDVEVGNDGRRQGCVKKHLGTPRSQLRICRRRLAAEFVDLLAKLDETVNLPDGLRDILAKRGKDLKYSGLKGLPGWYSDAVREFKSRARPWPQRNREGEDDFIVVLQKL